MIEMAQPRSYKHITEMTDEEREKILGNCEKAQASYEFCMREDGYNCERDRCKEAREAKEQEEKEKGKQLEALSKQNELLKKVNDAQNNKINELQSIIVQHNELLAQIVARLPPTQ
jgi:hypothetical protein